MAERIERTPRAATDIGEIAEYLRREAGLIVALRFLDNAEAVFRLLASTPRMGASLGLFPIDEPDIRRWQIPGFDDYLILYRPIPEGVQIVRVLHGARDIESLFQNLL